DVGPEGPRDVAGDDCQADTLYLSGRVIEIPTCRASCLLPTRHVSAYLLWPDLLTAAGVTASPARSTQRQIRWPRCKEHLFLLSPMNHAFHGSLYSFLLLLSYRRCQI
ncbi:hypothetical protein Z043-121606, partial [Arapaima gigas]